MNEQTHSQALFSEVLKTKSQTYFFDVKEAKNGNKYLNITAARIKDGQKFRSTITIFPDSIKEFSVALSKMQEKIK